MDTSGQFAFVGEFAGSTTATSTSQNKFSGPAFANGKRPGLAEFLPRRSLDMTKLHHAQTADFNRSQACNLEQTNGQHEKRD
jgi:hypothetical protein